MDGINKLVRDSIFLRFAANEDMATTRNARFNSSLWAVVAVLSLVLGLGLSGDHKLNANETIAPTLPLAYLGKGDIIETDFTKPLPKLNLTINNNNYTCIPTLEMPPTLSDKSEVCYPPNPSHKYSEIEAEDIFKKFMLIEEKRAL